MHKDQEKGTEEQLVSDGVEVLTEDRPLLERSGKETVEGVGEPGRDKKS